MLSRVHVHPTQHDDQPLKRQQNTAALLTLCSSTMSSYSFFICSLSAATWEHEQRGTKHNYEGAGPMWRFTNLA